MNNHKNKQIKVTSISDLQSYTRGQIVELPAFADGMPFVARMRRPSILVLAKNGKIPNDLLRTANELFTGKSKNTTVDDNTLSQMFDIFDILCEASFVEPTYQEIKDLGLEFTDEQYAFIFNYSQRGVSALKSFRE